MAAPNDPGLVLSPSAAFRAQMLEMIRELKGAAEPRRMEQFAAFVEAWWSEQQAWEHEISRTLEMHHEINNALVGVRGHAQLLLLGLAGSEPRMRDRLEVIIRESGRIEKAAHQISEIKSRLGRPHPAPGAA